MESFHAGKDAHILRCHMEWVDISIEYFKSLFSLMDSHLLNYYNLLINLLNKIECCFLAVEI